VARIDVFVYGTLRPGGRYHDRYCRGVVAIEPATARGRLEHLPAGYPMVTVPPADVLARGGADPLRDARLQEEWRTRLASAGSDASDAGEVVGELLSFDDPETRLPRLDELEDFRASGGGLYDRVLVRVRVTRTGAITPAWIYVAPAST
jgi:gamma-glutamylcyclotransferase (GGCT)/AIG2-like uncharacterized protein YtfP